MEPLQRLPCRPNDKIVLPAGNAAPEQVHVFAEPEIQAVNAALAAKRPLLLRGEPGVGKSQLAKAAALALKRAFVPFVVDARTEARDLQWHFDAVSRLAEAQLQRTGKAPLDDLDVKYFVQPRALWWAFNWTAAKRQAEDTRPRTPEPTLLPGCDPSNGVVVLIDEIDKGESDVPNGLLVALGDGTFTPQGLPPITADGVPPLVLITTNEERALPDAFVRRCLVLHLRLPGEPDKLIGHLVRRGRAHFPDVSNAVLRKAAQLVADDRAKAREEQWFPLPGQAEYLDLVRAARELEPNRPRAQNALLDRLRDFTLRKHVAALE